MTAYYWFHQEDAMGNVNNLITAARLSCFVLQ